MSSHKPWPLVIGLAVLGLADSIYLLLFQIRKVDKIACPVFKGGCEQVSLSPAAFPGGIPEATFGVIGYSIAALTAFAIILTKGKVKKLMAAAAIFEATFALGLSAYLTYAQPVKTGAWCFWCLTSATISVIMGTTAIIGAKKVLRNSQS